MKLIMAIINSSDERELNSEMIKGGFSVTRIGSSGGFLRTKMTTIMTAIKDERRVQTALDIIKKSVHSKKYSSGKLFDTTASLHRPVVGGIEGEVVIGGATVFVLSMDEFYKY